MPRVPRLALSLLAIASVGACSASPAQRFARAQTAFAAEDYQLARTELGQVLRKQPGNRAAMVLLAQTNLKLGDGDGAQALADRLRAAGASDADLRPIEAEASLERGQFDAALARLGSDASASAWRLRAAALLGKGDPSGAEAAFAQGQAHGGSFALDVDYARYLIGITRFGDAQPVLERLRRARAGALETLMLGGLLAEKTGRQDQALALYRDAARRYPSHPEPLVAEGTVLDSLDKLDPAIAAARAASRLAPDSAPARDLLITLYSEKGDWAKVRTLLQPRESELDPGSHDAMTYGEALLRLGHAEQARALFSQTVLVDPGNRYARMMLGEAQLATNDPDSALATLRPLLDGVFLHSHEVELVLRAAKGARDPGAAALAVRLQSPQVRAQMAVVEQAETAAARGDWPRAIDAYQRLRQFGQDRNLLERLAFAAAQAGQPGEAIAAADAVLAGAPGDPAALHLAGLVRINTRTDRERGVALLAAALAAAPDNPQFKADYQRAKAAAG